METKIINFAMTRGDTKRFGVKIKGSDGSPDAMTFSIKKTKNDESYVLQKTLTDGIELDEDQEGQQHFSITIRPEDTEYLDVGKYVYDLELIVNGDTITPVEGVITINGDVTRHLADRRCGCERNRSNDRTSQ